MLTSSSPEIPTAREIGVQRARHASAWQFGLSALAILGLWGLAASLIVLGIGELVLQSARPQEILPLLLFAAGLLLSGGLTLPSVGLSLANLLSRPLAMPTWLTLERLRNLIFALPVALVAGHWISTQPAVAWLLLPPIHVVALGLPILWLLWLGTRGLPSGSPQRAWGVFNAGLVLGPTLILFLEILAAIAILLLAGTFLASQPGLMQELMEVVNQLRDTNLTLQQITRALEPYLAQPGVPISIFLFLAGLVPLIEELIKPIGVWLLGTSLRTPAEGFVAGLVSGAGYALFENLALSSQSDTWALVVLARGGTGLLHMVTSGLFGWALVLAWRERRYAHMVLTYLLAIAIHALWNALSLLAFASSLEYPGADLVVGALQTVGQAAPWGLGLLTLATLALLLGFNHRLRAASERSETVPGGGE